jgi:type IV secretion system protein VirB6
MQIFQGLQRQILPPITAAVDKASTLAEWMAAPVMLGLTIVIMLQGFGVMRGVGGSNPILDVAAKVGRPVLVTSLALFSGMYASTVVGFMTGLRSDLTGLFSGAGNSYAALDQAVVQVLRAAQAGMTEALASIGISDLTGLVRIAMLAVIVFCFLVYAVFAAVNLILVDASLAILFGVGPLFVAAYAFEATAKFFDTWLSAVLKYTFTAVVLAVLLGIANALILRYASRSSSGMALEELLWSSAGAICSIGVLIALVSRAGSLAADIAGGVSVSLAGMAQAAKALAAGASAGSGAARGVANTAGYLGGAAAGAAGRTLSSTPLGLRTLQATQSMRDSVSRVASGAKSFGHAVTGRKTDSHGNVRSGYGVGNAFSIGRQAAMARTGTGTVTGGRPVPSANWRD